MKVIEFIGSAVIITALCFVFMTVVSGGQSITVTEDYMRGRIKPLTVDREYCDSLLKVQEAEYIKMGIPESACKPVEF